MTAEEIIAALDLSPHPEGGWFKRTQTLKGGPNNKLTSDRGLMSAIYYLITAGAPNKWHRIDADEVYHYYMGAPLLLRAGPSVSEFNEHIIGTDLKQGQRPQFLCPAGHWQQCESLGDWTLVGCTVAPEFQFDGWEIIEAE